VSKTVRFYFDFVSPYSYLAATQIEALAERTGAAIDYRPIHVGTLMTRVGNRPTSIECAAKRNYSMGDLARWAKRLQTPVVMNLLFGKLDTRPLLTATIAAKELGHEKAAIKALFAGMWVEQSNFADDAAMLSLFKRHAVPDGAAIVALGKEKGEALTELIVAAEADGAFGVPSFVYAGQLFFGNDRMMFLEEALAT
jgi:2-hydroxychromene-2-carboxylate isomerase